MAQTTTLALVVLWLPGEASLQRILAPKAVLLPGPRPFPISSWGPPGSCGACPGHPRTMECAGSVWQASPAASPSSLTGCRGLFSGQGDQTHPCYFPFGLDVGVYQRATHPSHRSTTLCRYLILPLITKKLDRSQAFLVYGIKDRVRCSALASQPTYHH